MEVIIFEAIVLVFRVPGAYFLAAVTKKDVDHWMDRSNAFESAIVGAALISLFIYIAVLDSG